MANHERLTEFIKLYKELNRRFAFEKNKFSDGVISGSQAMILHVLAEAGAQKITSLAETLLITPGAVTSLSDKLISGGYAKRIRTEEDRRVVYLEITEKGRAALQAYREHTLKIAHYFFAGISDEDMDHLIRIYRQTLNHLDNQQEE